MIGALPRAVLLLALAGAGVSTLSGCEGDQRARPDPLAAAPVPSCPTPSTSGRFSHAVTLPRAVMTDLADAPTLGVRAGQSFRLVLPDDGPLPLPQPQEALGLRVCLVARLRLDHASVLTYRADQVSRGVLITTGARPASAATADGPEAKAYRQPVVVRG